MVQGRQKERERKKESIHPDSSNRNKSITDGVPWFPPENKAALTPCKSSFAVLLRETQLSVKVTNKCSLWGAKD